VGPETIVAPSGWEDRLVRLEFPAIRRADAPVIGWCLSFDDLVLAKLAAGREHDLAFVEAAVREGMVDNDQFSLGLELMPEGYREDVQTRMQHIRACVGGLSG
ncbi:MAG: DUF6036 family nucleotidyltransferase, partial [Gaiellaceae bacterium]